MVRTRKFTFWLIALSIAGLVLRLAYAYFSKWDQKVWGDAFYYHFQANGLVDGAGFMKYLPTLVNGQYQGGHVAAGLSADHPPLAPLYYAFWSLFGLSSFHWHMVAGCVVGAGTVFMCGLLGREVVGERTGLIAAGIAAVYANLWVYDPLVTSETLTIFMVSVVLFWSYRFWRKPSMWNGVWFGMACGVAALTRAEVIAFIPVVFLPFVLRVKDWDWKYRLKVLVVASSMVLLFLAPWVIRNMTTFKHPLYLSGGAEITLMSANCDLTYNGPLLGWWSMQCLANDRGELKTPSGDASEQAAEWSRRARTYISEHLGDLPRVELARLGRVFELYHPGSPWGPINGDQKIAFDVYEGRAEYAARIALAQYYVLMPLAIAGGVILWRRRVTILPVLGLLLIVVSAVLISFGNTRYRSPLEVGVVLFAAVTIDALIRRWKPPRADAGTEDEPPADGHPTDGPPNDEPPTDALPPEPAPVAG